MADQIPLQVQEVTSSRGSNFHQESSNESQSVDKPIQVEEITSTIPLVDRQSILRVNRILGLEEDSEED